MNTPSPSAVPSVHVTWRAVIPAFSAVTVSVLPGFLTAGLAVQIGNGIGLGLTGLGVVIGIFFAASTLGSPLMGTLVQRVGWARGLRLSSFMAAVSLAGIAFAAPTPFAFGAWFVLGGLAASLAQPAANLTVARCVGSRRRGLLFGAKHASAPAAIFLGGLAVPVVALTVGWEWAFWGGSALALATALAVPLRPADHEVHSPARPVERVGRPSTPLGLLIALAGAAMLGIGGINALASFTVTYAVHTGFGESTAGLLLAGGSLAGIATRLVAGWLIDRTDHADLTAVASMLTVGALGVAGIAVGTHAGLILGGLLAFGAGWGWSGLFTFTVVKDNPEAPATATGITQTGVFLGAAIGPPIFGLVADGISFAAAWWMTGAALVGAAVIIVFVRSRRHTHLRSASTWQAAT
ncbi:major Facilitator Superfamily protein [bacterium BMS3Bbin01]|nr:major Facilitator Superfamily protein [bacterium BMS3Bbin01]